MIFEEGQVAVNVNRQSKISDMKNILLSAICFVKVYGSKIIEINLKKIVNYLKMRRPKKSFILLKNISRSMDLTIYCVTFLGQVIF